MHAYDGGFNHGRWNLKMIKKTLASAIILMPLALAMALTAPPAAAGDAAAGARVFNRCRACHAIDAEKRSPIGPNLSGVLGRESGTLEGFRYSNAMLEKDITWTEENLRAFVASPRTFVPGTRMGFPGLRSEEQIDNLIAYIRTQMPQAESSEAN
jgi:cytochrome c